MRDAVRRGIVPVLVILGLFAPSVLVADPVSIHGSLSDRYRFRTTGGLSDHDMETLLTLDVGNVRSDPFSGAVQFGGKIDLDGNQGGTVFPSVYDTFSAQSAARLYYAYFNANDLGALKNLRVGRQHRHDFENLYFDGAYLEFDSFHTLTLSAYGGIPVHLFESQFGWDRGDWMLGAGLQWDPLSNLRAKLDYVHLRDEVSGFRATAGDHEDNLFGTTVYWDVDSHVGFAAKFTTFTDHPRDVTFETSLRFPEQKLNIRFEFYRLLLSYAIRVIELDAYGVVGAYEPYSQFGIWATKGLGDHFAIDGGVQIRVLDNKQVAGAFNHGYKRFNAALSCFDLPWKGLSLTASGDFYQGDDNTLKNDNYGGSFTASQKLFDKRLILSGGTNFYLYRYNIYSGNESTNVQTLFARVEGKIWKGISGRVGYEFENNDINDVSSVDVKLTWKF